MSRVLKHCSYLAICIIFFLNSCSNRTSGEDKKMVTNPNAMDKEVADQIESALNKLT